MPENAPILFDTRIAPWEVIAIWRRFEDYSRKKGGKPPEFLSTRPMDNRRIAELECLPASAMDEFERTRRR